MNKKYEPDIFLNVLYAFWLSIAFSLLVCVVWMGLEHVLYGEIQNRLVDNIIYVPIIVCFFIMFYHIRSAKQLKAYKDAMSKEYEHYIELKKELEDLYGSTMTFDMVIDALKNQIRDPEKKSDVYARVLTYEDADLFDEWKREKAESERPKKEV